MRDFMSYRKSVSHSGLVLVEEHRVPSVWPRDHEGVSVHCAQLQAINHFVRREPTHFGFGR